MFYQNFSLSKKKNVWQNFNNQLIKNYLRTYDNIQKVTIDQGDDYTASCLLDYPYFKKIIRW